MKRILIPLLFLSFTALLYSQWEWQNPKPDGNDIRDLKFATGQIGYAVGNRGKILKTSDGGETWFALQSHTTHDLKKVAVVNSSNVWIIGNISGGYDILMHTTDGGLNWTSQIMNGAQYVFYGIFFLDENNGWMIGRCNYYRKTTNGGNTWTNISLGLDCYSGDPVDIYFKDINMGWAPLNNGKYLSTTNGGSTWTINIPDSTTTLYSVFFLDNNNGWMCGDGILKTSNGGILWQKISNEKYINSVCFSSPQNGLAVSSSRRLFKTTDGGNSWTPMIINVGTYSLAFYSVKNLSSAEFIIAGEAGVILKSTDTGISWQIKTNSFYNNLNSVCFIDQNTGWVTGEYGKIYKTTDGGQNWFQQTSPSGSENKCIKFINSSTGWICGVYGTILKTTNGGTAWTSQSVGSSHHLYSISIIDANNVWLAGSSGALFKTTNGGTTWNLITTGFSNSMAAVNFVSSSVGYAGGTSGLIIKTTDGGATWQNISPSGALTVYDIAFINQQKGFAAASNLLYITTDGGLSWSTKPYGYIRSISIVDSLNIFAVPDWSHILKTTDGGINWNYQKLEVYQYFWGVSAVNKNTAWVVGNHGNILRTTNGGTPTINLSLWIADNLNLAKISEKVIKEGEKYIIPPKKLDPPFTKYQTIYNGIDSSVFYIEGGALSKSITLRIIMSIPGGDSLYGLIGGKKVWFYGVFEVDGAVGEFYFNYPYGAVLKVPKNKDFSTMTSLIGFSPGSTWYFGYYNNAEAKWDSVGIESQSGTDTVTARIRHFSEIGAGDESLITGVKDKETGIIPASYSLAQNYPNPFNPVTKIKYSIPQTQNRRDLLVTLKVYDILGREITTLINETKQPGNYTIEFNGSRYPSGIYFYELKTGDYREAKKMMMIK